MRRNARIAAMLFTLVSGPAFPQAAPPLLDHMKAMNLAFDALNSRFGRGDYGVGGVDFDETRREWRVGIDRGEGKTPQRLVVSISEATGEICAHAPAQDGCAASADASAALAAERDKRAALDRAARNPPPDLQGVMVALIRYQATTQGGYLHANDRNKLYVAMRPPNQGKPIDLSPEAIRSLRDLGRTILPGSRWSSPANPGHIGSEMSMGVGLPRRRADGDYEVDYGFWCGTLCASSHTAVLRHDARGWRVVSSHMTSIS